MSECKYEHTERFGLYFMIVIILIASIKSCAILERAQNPETGYIKAEISK